MKVSLECTSLAALAAALTDRMLKHADYAAEMCADGDEPGDAARWSAFARLLRRGGSAEVNASLEAALDCLIVEQETLPPCPRCGGQRDRDPGGEVYCTECHPG